MDASTARALGRRATALIASMLFVGTLAGFSSNVELGPGCDASRPAVVHRAGEAVVDGGVARVA